VQNFCRKKFLGWGKLRKKDFWEIKEENEYHNSAFLYNMQYIKNAEL